MLLAACGHEAARPAATPAPTVDPEVRALRAQLAQALAERDAALARLHALSQRKAAVVRVVVHEPAPAASPKAAGDSGQPQVFTTLTTATVSP